MREYRKRIVNNGQHSPDYLNDYVVEVIKKINENNKQMNKIADIGCGLGYHCIKLKNRFPEFKYIGVDFSEATLNYLNGKNIFDETYLAGADVLPISDNYVDIAISMENLEHLYAEEVIPALRELSRISKYIIITTPTPDRVVNVGWLNKEIAEAATDTIPLSEHDFRCLECCVHKSVITPQSFLDAGFQQIKIYGTESECYYIESSNLLLSKIKVKGISRNNLFTKCELKNKYIDLLNKSLSLNYILYD